MINFPDTSAYAFFLYQSANNVKLNYLGVLSQNLWEGFCNFSGESSGHAIRKTDVLKFI